MAISLALPDLEATRTCSRAIANCLRDGDIILLSGEVGAGKTTFTSMLARELGIVEHVRSPTYTIAHQYQHADGVRTLSHLDLYRQVGAVDDSAWGDIEPYLDATWTCVEWPDHGAERLSHRPCWTMTFDHVSPVARVVSITTPTVDRNDSLYLMLKAPHG